MIRYYMNEPQYCYFCRRVTHTKEWDCVCCGLSKGHPEVFPRDFDLPKEGEDYEE